jgi:hypothetical protein
MPETIADFSPHLNTNFKLGLDGQGELDLKLFHIHDYNETPEQRAKVNSFSLEFQGPPDPQLPQRIYELTHDVMGRFEIFLVPIARNQQGVVYQAVYNTFVRPAD